MNTLTPTPSNRWIPSISVSLGVIAVTVGVLAAMGRPFTCENGTIKLWHGAVNSSENSQHIADWYTFTHVTHGFLFYFLLWLLSRQVKFLQPAGIRLLCAVILEAGGEILENTPFIINRYREATIALGYTGDSILNSVSDIVFMSCGFLLAWRLPTWLSILIVIVLETMLLLLIRDNLSLNILMLLYPIDSVRDWQAGM
ncbi:MAG: hypothetical protein CMJ32_01630 [Phycisphaerae bacterium]|nr:hypothetical protein [Phycisphaerae bacterium]